MKIQESGENYLETILILEMEKGNVRSIDVANHLEFSKASISRAMGILKDDGYIVVDENLHLVLTQKGRAKAEDVYNRHRLLTSFIMKITGLSQEQSEENACRVEHVIDSDVVKGIEDWMKRN